MAHPKTVQLLEVVQTLQYLTLTAVNKVLNCLSRCLHHLTFGFATVRNVCLRELVSYSLLVKF